MITFRDYRALYGVRTPYAGDYGIEIETQSSVPYTYPEIDGWVNEPDGSIRQYGREYKLHRPVSYDQVYNSLLLWRDHMKPYLGDMVISKYCSVHVHVNVSKMTLKELANFTTLYFIVEEVLNKYCGPDRDGNVFCLKSALAAKPIRVLNQFYSLLSDRDFGPAYTVIDMISEDDLKYNALGLSPLRTKQSVEIRTHSCSYNPHEIFRWVTIIEDMKRFSLREGLTPSMIIHKFAEDDIRGAMEDVFDENIVVLPFDEDSINKGLFNAIRMCDTVDWEVIDSLTAGDFQNMKVNEPMPGYALNQEGSMANTLEQLARSTPWEGHMVTVRRSSTLTDYEEGVISRSAIRESNVPIDYEDDIDMTDNEDY